MRTVVLTEEEHFHLRRILRIITRSRRWKKYSKGEKRELPLPFAAENPPEPEWCGVKGEAK